MEDSSEIPRPAESLGLRELSVLDTIWCMVDLLLDSTRDSDFFDLEVEPR